MKKQSRTKATLRRRARQASGRQNLPSELEISRVPWRINVLKPMSDQDWQRPCDLCGSSRWGILVQVLSSMGHPSSVEN